MAPTDETPEYVVFTRPGVVTGDMVLITNKGKTWISGYDDRTGMKNGLLIGGKFIISS